MSKLIAGVLIGLATMAGLYAVAATTASALAASFITAETTHYSRTLAFETEVKRISAEHKAARAKCKVFTGAKRNRCNSEARVQEQRAFRSAQL